MDYIKELREHGAKIQKSLDGILARLLVIEDQIKQLPEGLGRLRKVELVLAALVGAAGCFGFKTLFL